MKNWCEAILPSDVNNLIPRMFSVSLKLLKFFPSMLLSFVISNDHMSRRYSYFSPNSWASCLKAITTLSLSGPYSSSEQLQRRKKKAKGELMFWLNKQVNKAIHRIFSEEYLLERPSVLFVTRQTCSQSLLTCHSKRNDVMRRVPMMKCTLIKSSPGANEKHEKISFCFWKDSIKKVS